MNNFLTMLYGIPELFFLTLAICVLTLCVEIYNRKVLVNSVLLRDVRWRKGVYFRRILLVLIWIGHLLHIGLIKIAL
jgi:hypothetical protein